MMPWWGLPPRKNRPFLGLKREPSTVVTNLTVARSGGEGFISTIEAGHRTSCSVLFVDDRPSRLTRMKRIIWMWQRAQRRQGQESGAESAWPNLQFVRLWSCSVFSPPPAQCIEWVHRCYGTMNSDNNMWRHKLSSPKNSTTWSPTIQLFLFIIWNIYKFKIKLKI